MGYRLIDSLTLFLSFPFHFLLFYLSLSDSSFGGFRRFKRVVVVCMLWVCILHACFPALLWDGGLSIHLSSPSSHKPTAPPSSLFFSFLFFFYISRT